MGWEIRGSQRCYYKPVRVEGKVRKVYYGGGAAGNYHAILDQRAARLQAPARAEQVHQRHIVRTGDRLWRELWTGLSLLVEASMILAGFYRHNGQWRRAKRPARTRRKTVSLPLKDDNSDLAGLVRQAHSADEEARESLRQFLSNRTEWATRIEDALNALQRHWQATGFLEDAAEPEPAESELECWLGRAMRLAVCNRNHAASLIDPGSVTPWLLTTRYQRLESADLRVRKIEQLAEQARKARAVWVELTRERQSGNHLRTAS